MRTIREAIDAQAGAQPAAPFLLAPEPDLILTYLQLRDTARALCVELAARGIRPGDVVSYMLPNGIGAASVLLGAMYGGYVVSPVSLLAQDSQIEYTLAHSETRIVFAAPEFVDRLRMLVARSGSRAIVRPTSVARPPARRTPCTMPVLVNQWNWSGSAGRTGLGPMRR
jgi:acyl-CoA synthetase (AMP-forming)/AMP-acid ligase II